MWEDTVEKLKRVLLLLLDIKRWIFYRIENNFINNSDDMICHVRPHQSKSDYRENGQCADYLPSPAKWINRPEDKIKYSSQWMTKQCFWINNTYIKTS